MELGVPPPRYTVLGVHFQECRPISRSSAARYRGSSSRGRTPDEKLQYVHFWAQKG